MFLKMDSQKVQQVLKQIFEMYGVEIARKPNSFRAAVFDLLDELNYRDERIVLRNAIESDAILPLVTMSPVTEDTVARVEEKLIKSGHMAAEDAEFVIRCVLSARGQNPDTVTEKRISHENMEKVQQKEIREQYQSQGNREQNQSRKNQEQNQNKQEQGRQNENSVFEVECKRGKKEGKLCLYKDKLIFNQYLQRTQTEIYYYNISKIQTQGAAIWIMIMFCIYGILLAVVCLAVAGIVYGFICGAVSVWGLIYTLSFSHKCLCIRAGFKNHQFVFKSKEDRNRALDIVQTELKRC